MAEQIKNSKKCSKKDNNIFSKIWKTFLKHYTKQFRAKNQKIQNLETRKKWTFKKVSKNLKTYEWNKRKSRNIRKNSKNSKSQISKSILRMKFWKGFQKNFEAMFWWFFSKCKKLNSLENSQKELYRKKSIFLIE